MGVTQNLLYTWKQNTDELDISLVNPDENTELLALKKEVKSPFIREHRSLFPTKMLCNTLKVSRSAFYDWLARPAQIVTERKIGLVVRQRRAYKVTTTRKHSDSVANNILKQQFNPTKPYTVWAGDVTYLRTHQGWMYITIVMDLHSRRIVG